MGKLSDNKLYSLQHNVVSNDDYWYITKQECNIRNLCYIGEILSRWDPNSPENYQDFFDRLKTTPEFNKYVGSTAHRATINLTPYGLRRDEKGYNPTDLTEVFFRIKEITHGNYNDTSIYQSIIDEQVERINIVTTHISISPMMFTFKVLLTIGDVTGDYAVSKDEFKTFISTATKWNEFFEVVDSILRYRTDSQYRNDVSSSEGRKLANDTRFNLVIENHSMINVDGNQISIPHRFVDDVRMKVARYELQNPTDIEVDSTIKTSLEKPLQIIFYGAPGTGKSHKIDNDPHVTDENTIRTTFHPDSDYSTFVGAYKPTMQPMPIHAFVGTTVHHANNAANEKAFERKIVYKYVPQAFLKAYVAAWSDLGNPHFLVIEEINRGNCAQIFGDLFQLLDRNSQGASSYAINADEDISQFLRDDENGFDKLPEETAKTIRSFVLKKDNGKTEPIGADILSGKKLLLPHNLYIWATMNTSDQSLFPIDSAFKRRWNWEYIPIRFFDNDPARSLSNRSFEIGNTRYSWADFLRTINPIISELTESADKQMGFFFAKPDKKSDPELKDNDVISEKVFLNKVLFYLWTDVLKDFNVGREEFKKPDGKNLEFTDFFEEGNTYLAAFVSKLGIAVIGNEDDTDNTSDEAVESDSDKASLTVVFSDGETITGSTRFEAYSKALLKIGLDKVEPIAAEMKYKRHNAPLISKEQHQAIVDASNYTYVPFDKYFLIKGMNGKTMRNFLNLVSQRLNLGLTVNYK